MANGTTSFPAFIRLDYDENGVNSRFERDIRSMTQSAEQKFKASFDEVSRTIDRALSVKRNDFGSLDLGVDELKNAAAAQEARAIAAREVATATALAAKAEGDYSRSARLATAATSALAREEEEAARAARSQAAAAEQVQLQLNKNKSATDALVLSQRQGTNAGGAVVNSLGSQRFAMIQVGQQLQDITVGFASGQRVATIFAQQLPQLGFALTGFNGKLGALGRLLAGPAGVAIFAAVTVASFALSEAFEDTGDKADDLERKNRSLADTLNDAKSSYQEVTDALREYNKEQEKSREITLLAAQEEAKSIEVRLRKAIATKQALLAQIELNFEEARAVPAGPGGEINSQAISETFELKKRIEELKKEITGLTDASGNAVIKVAESISEINTDPTVRIRTGFELLRQEANKSIKDVDKLAKRLTDLKNQENAAIEAVRQSTRKSSTKLPPVTLAEVKSILERELGAVVGSTTRTKAQNAAVGGSATSFHLFGQALDLPFSKGRNAEISKEDIRRVLAEEGISVQELLGRGDKDHNDHTHVAFSRRRRSPEQLANSLNKDAERAAAAAARETSRLASLSDQAAESIARINEQYDEQPRLVDRAAQSTRKLDSIISELSDPKNAGTPRLKELIAEAEQARITAANAVSTEISRYGEENEKNLEIMALQAAGLFDQAEILQEINRLDERLGLSSALEKLTEQKIEAQGILEDEQSTTAERAAALVILEKTAVEMAKIRGQQEDIANEARSTHEATKDYARQISRVTEALNDQLDVVDSIEQSLTGLLGGKVSGKEFIKDLKDSFRELQARTTFRSIFGDTFDQIRAELNKDTPLGQANARLVKEVDKTAGSASDVAESFDFVAEAANAAAARLQGISNPQAIGVPGAANDNGVIVVDGIRKAISIENRSVSQLADAMANGIVGPLSGSLNEIFGTKFSQQLTGALSSALSGYLQGGEVGGVLGGLQGITKVLGDEGVLGKGIAESFSKTLGGAVGGAGTGTQVAGIAKALGLGGSFSTTGSQIGGAIGSVIPIPGGEIIGSVIGGFLGGLFKKKPAGQAGITSVDGAARISSNKSAVADSLGNLSAQLQQSIINIAEQFDAEIGAFSVSVGQREDYFRVAGSASTDTGRKNTAGFLYDGKDPEQALRIAILDALRDGAIKGIREGSQRLLTAGRDLEKAVQDALSFEGVFKRLRAYKDPVGAALDALDKEFEKLVEIFGRAGASAQEYADLEELYGIERAQAVKEASERITGSLRDLFRDLTIGDSGLSLRTRLGNAQAEYDPLAQRVAAGDITAYDDYAEAARNLLDLQREVYGSSEDYFRLLDEVTQLTKTRIDEESNIASLAVDRDTPFTVDQTPVVNAINYQTELLASFLAAIVKNGGASVTGVGTGGGRKDPINRDVVNF